MNNLPPGYTQDEIDGFTQTGFRQSKKRKSRFMAQNVASRANGWTDKQYHEYQLKRRKERNRLNDEQLERLNNYYESLKDEEEYERQTT